MPANLASAFHDGAPGVWNVPYNQGGRLYASGGWAMGSGGIGLIPDQLGFATADDSDIIAAVMTGGGNDFLVPATTWPGGAGIAASHNRRAVVAASPDVKRVVWSPEVLLLALAVHACGSEDAAPRSGTGADAATAMPADASASAPAAVTVTGPVTGGMGMPFSTAVVDLAAQGYRETEYFFAGDAVAYAVQGEMTMDGKWELEETTEAPYKSRLLVRRPIDAAEFNGTVVVEWLNVSGGADGDPGFMYNWQELLREGYAWVGVSAQATGIEGGGFALVAAAMPLKQYDPDRYGSLSHPGDAYSFDIYTQAAQVIRGAGEIDVLDDLEPERLIAYGESQSAMRLVSYVDGVHPLTRVYDGFFIHSRSAGGVPFTNDATLIPIGGAPVFIRDDLDEPVFQFQTETDVLGAFGYLAARQPDTERLRTWEVAGTAHADAYILDINAGQGASLIACEGVNDGPQHFVLKAALHALNLWMTDGSEPATAEPLQHDDAGDPELDEHGNTLGGVRTPDVDVPIATLSGQPPAGSGNILCALFGQTTPFTPEKLLDLYPSHDAYVTKVEDAARAAREANFLLEPEEQAMVAEAEAVPIPN